MLNAHFSSNTHFSLPSVIKESVIVWLHIPLGRDTTNLHHGMALMNLSTHWPVILCNMVRGQGK